MHASCCQNILCSQFLCGSVPRWGSYSRGKKLVAQRPGVVNFVDAWQCFPICIILVNLMPHSFNVPIHFKRLVSYHMILVGFLLQFICLIMYGGGYLVIIMIFSYMYIAYHVTSFVLLCSTMGWFQVSVGGPRTQCWICIFLQMSLFSKSMFLVVILMTCLFQQLYIVVSELSST